MIITLEYLNKYEKDKKNYEYEIQRIEKDIYITRENEIEDSVSGSSKVYPYIKQHVVVKGIDGTKIRRLEKRKKIIENKKEKLDKELEYKLKRLSEEDSILADIVRKRYIDKLEWKQIAMRLNYAGESGVRNYFNRCFTI